MSVREEKLIRELVTVILASRLSLDEILKLSENLRFNREFVVLIADLLADFSARARFLNSKVISKPKASRKKGDKSNANSGLVDLILKKVKNSSITRSALKDAIERAGYPAGWVYPSEKPMAFIVSSFAEVATQQQMARFMAEIGAEIQQDAYLIGIEESRRR